MTLRPHNDWSGIVPDPAAAEALTAAVVIPVYNRPDLLARTLAGLERSTRKVPVIVADDGSTADIASVVEASPLDVTLVRQEHDGNGAARARNLGAAHAGDVDVLIFVDADCIPHPDLVANHLAWHTASESVVTIGRRVHVRVADIPIESIASGEADLETRIQTGFSGRPDFRTVLQRRTAHSTAGDEAFRTFVSSNVAVPRFLFEATGGFADRFPHWGAEDTELGWRLWQEGAFFVPVENALVYHQLDEDEEGGYEGRKTARLLNDGALATLVPHGFYRKPRRDVIYEVPKVSIVVHQPPTTLDDLWSDVASQTAPDFELILAGCDERHEPMAGLLEGDPRVSLVSSLAEGIAAARGELVVTVHGSAALDHRFLARVVKHFHDRPTASSLTVGYTIPSDPPQTYLSADDATFVDSGWQGELPIVTIARRRDWVKARSLEPTQAWAEIRRLDRPDHLPQGLVWLPGARRTPRPAGFVANRPTRAEMVKDLRSDPRRAVRTVAKILRARSQGVPYSIPTAHEPEQASTSQDRRPHARYVGWVGYDNLGDEAMLEAARRLLPWADVETSGSPRDLLLLGGGTLINRSTYLGWLAERDSPRIERAVLGTGVANPAYWGVTEPVDGWLRWLSTCCYVGVRGPRSEATLREWGYDGPLEVSGDPALLLERPSGAESSQSRIVVSPAWTNGELWGESDEAVMDTLAKSVRQWLGEGREVAFLSCNPADDRPIFEIMREAGKPDLPYTPGYRDMDAALRLLASAGLVVGERLHAVVLAAAVGAPFVALEYRPKLADFAASVGADEVVLRTDQLSVDRIEDAGRRAVELQPTVAQHVDDYRRRLRAAGQVIREAVEG
ncbi:MAG TPA: glycosyltransferase [Acidimicrobiia bacterium]|nr:glycosyltransferase [Acidimicrobiia bacterium]